MLRFIRIASLVAAALLAAVTGYVYLTRGEAVVSVADIGGPFRLASANGGVVDSQDLAGKPFAVFFGFTRCPEVCPTTMAEMSAALTELGDQGKDLRVFFVTVDPERDTADFLKDYLSSFDPRIEALVPTADELAAMARAFRAFYAKSPTSDGGYTMDHTATVFLMDRQGKLASTISYGEEQATRMAKLRKLLGV
ncbi:MAG: SCO family protein [Alphaproteobacteria bacterium]|jgi:protein SCO1/2|nr:SCO family protein [Alphaproteobacteria bacterium]